MYTKTRLCKEDTELLETLVTERNLKDGAIRRFTSPVKKYLKFHKNKKTMTQLIKEAHKEQDKGIPLHKTKLYQYLTGFRLYLNDEVSPRTLKNYLIRIKEVYRHNNITIPELKPFKIREPPQVTYDDIPTRDEIIRAVEISPTDMKALILFQSSSGTTLHESLTITVGMFLEACKEYIEDFSKSIVMQLTQLYQYSIGRDVVPTFYLERVKTNKYYYTCCSPEATSMIIKYLKLRITDDEQLTPDSKLFPYYKNVYTKRFHDLNERLGLGFVGSYSKFRSHALRKYHASNIDCSVEVIDELQGRGKSTVHEAYIKDKPEKIKQVYVEHMHNVMLYDTIPRSKCEEEEQCVVEENRTTPEVDNGLVFELIKQVGKLEQRIDILEQKLGG